jgi:hypothetical protein
MSTTPFLTFTAVGEFDVDLLRDDIKDRYRNAGQCSGLQSGGEGPRWEGRQSPSSAVDRGTVLPGSGDNQAEARRANVAAGPAETKNACGADVRPGLAWADRGEAGTHPGVARSARSTEGILGLQADGGSQLQRLKTALGCGDHHQAREINEALIDLNIATCHTCGYAVNNDRYWSKPSRPGVFWHNACPTGPAVFDVTDAATGRLLRTIAHAGSALRYAQQRGPGLVTITPVDEPASRHLFPGGVAPATRWGR